mgnify:CR=1 FL=1
MRRQLKIFIALLLVIVMAVLMYAYWVGLLNIRYSQLPGIIDRNNRRCPNVSSRILPACELERRRPEMGRTYCPRGVCAEGLKAVPDTKTAYMICIPQDSTVEVACP